MTENGTENGTDTAAVTPILTGMTNLKRGNHWFLNSRGERLHVRIYTPPENVKIRGLYYFTHGYGGHSNDPKKTALGTFMAEKGYFTVLPDIIGHGYSEGVRAYCENWQYWIDDHLQLLKIVASPVDPLHEKGDNEAASHCLGISPEQGEQLAKVPIFLSGESLGGAHTLATGLRLQEMAEEGDPVAKRFAGAVLIAPAIIGNTPNRVVTFILRHVLARLFPHSTIPASLDTVLVPGLVWVDPADEERCMADAWGSSQEVCSADAIDESSLGWCKTMRYGMGVSMLQITEYLTENVKNVKFPFLSMHDPGDGIVQYAGTALLRDTAQTPDDKQSPSRSKEVIDMIGLLHDLLSNATQKVLDHIYDWTEDRLTKMQKLET